MMPALSISAKAAFESLVADANWTEAFAQAKLIAIENPLDRDIRTWVGFTIAEEWGDDGRDKVEALWPKVPEAKDIIIGGTGIRLEPPKVEVPPAGAEVVELKPLATSKPKPLVIEVPSWEDRLRALPMDFEEHWLPMALTLVAESAASTEEIAGVLDEVWEDGEKQFLEALPKVEPKVDPTPTPEPIVVPLAVPLVKFGDLGLVSNSTPASLDKKHPYESAKQFVSRFFIKEGFLSLYFWQGSFYSYSGQYYTKLSSAKMREMIYAFLDTSISPTGARFAPMDHDYREVMNALEAGLSLETNPTAWLHKPERVDDVLMFKNGLVEISTGRLSSPNPRLWIHSALDYDWNPEAKCPRWMEFLEQIFPDDEQARTCIEEQLGYCMTDDVRLEKAFMWVGVPRSGKGTVVSILESLVGRASYISLSTNTWVASENSRQSLIGKKVGCFPDVRLKPGKRYGSSFDAGGLSHQSVELLLRIIAGDTISIKRMYDGVPWEGRLPMKIVWVGNHPPNLNDEQALPSRFIKLAFNQSFLGKEDVTLKSRLHDELPGIASRCLQAYRRLIVRGRFIQPGSASELEHSVVTNSDPFTEFVLTHFVPDVNGLVNKSHFRLSMEVFGHKQGYEELLRLTPTVVSRRLAGVPGFADFGSYRPAGGQRSYTGFRCKSKTELVQE